MIMLHDLPPSERREQIQDIAQSLIDHPLYDSITSLSNVRVYMEHHVWCVWDFMALVKAIQRYYLCGEVAWIPPEDGQIGHYIYQLLQTEETDVTENGGIGSSHFETYLRAMDQAGANRSPIDAFIAALRRGCNPLVAINVDDVPKTAQDFVATTLRIASGPIHGAAAAFCLGRERIIPEMFSRLLRRLSSGPAISGLQWYLNRHVVLDTETHGPLSTLLLRKAIGDSEERWSEAVDIAIEALMARRQFLDGVLSALHSTKEQEV